MFVALRVELRAFHRRRLYFRVLGHCQNIVGVLSCVPRRTLFVQCTGSGARESL
jgi:hypothetical protein